MQAGDTVTWIYTPRGGYGWPIPVDGEVVHVTPKRVVILVSKRDGTLVKRAVAPGRLRPR